MESMLATKNQREFELESTRKELAAIKLKLEHSQRTLLQEKRQNAQLRGALDKSASNQQLFISLFEEARALPPTSYPPFPPPAPTLEGVSLII